MHTMHARRWFAAGFALLLALPVGLYAQDTAAPAAPSTGSAAADPMALLNLIPQDATVVVAIRSLREFDADIQAISGRLGFPMGPDGFFPGPLDWVKDNLGLTEGVNDNGGVAFVILNASKTATIEELPGRMALYIPASDPKALITGMGGTAKEGAADTYEVTVGDEPLVAASKNGYVIMASTMEVLSEAMRAPGGVAKAMAGDRIEAYRRGDLLGWVNLSGIGPEVRKAAFEAISGLMNMANPTGTDQSAGVIRQLEKFMTEGDQVSLSLDLSAKGGLVISLYSRVKPDSDAAKMIAAVKPPKGSSLIGLPDEPVILAAGGAAAITPEMEKEIRRGMEDLIKQVSQGEDSPIKPDTLKPLLDSYINCIKMSEQVSLSVSSPAEPGQAGMINLVLVGMVKDAEGFRGELRRGFNEAKKVAMTMAKDAEIEQAQIDQVAGAFDWKENAGTVAGASVDQLTVDMAKLPEITPEQIEQVKAVIGQEGVMIRVGVIGKHVIVTFGGGEERFAKVVGLASKGEAPLGKNADIAKMGNRVPKGEKVSEFYLNADHLLAAINRIAEAVGSPLPVKLSMKNPAPLTMFQVNVDKTAQQVDIIFPVELMVGISDTVKQAMAMAMSGMGGMQGGMDEGVESPGQDSQEEPAPGADKDDADEKPARAPGSGARRPANRAPANTPEQ